MRQPSRMIVLVGLASLVVTPLPALAAPAETEPAPLDSDDEELPLDTDDEELPLDTDSDEPPAPELDEELDHETDGAIEDGYDPLRDSPEAKTARRWLNAGITATTAGALLVGGAIALGLTDPCDPSAGNSCFTDSRNRAAITMGVPGGVLLLGGVAMTVVGAVQKRQLAVELAGSLSAGRDHIGVLLVGRF